MGREGGGLGLGGAGVMRWVPFGFKIAVAWEKNRLLGGGLRERGGEEGCQFLRILAGPKVGNGLLSCSLWSVD